MRMAHGFDPAATYQVSTWRGIEYGGRQFRDGEMVTAAEIPPSTLYTFYRFRAVAPVQPGTSGTTASTRTTTKTTSAAGTQAPAASTVSTPVTAASSIGISVEPQPRHGEGVITLPRPPRDRKWLASATTDELRQECEVRGLDTRGEKSQLRGRLFPLVG